MKEFMMIFRTVPNATVQLSPEQMQANIKLWQDWIAGIAAQGKFVGSNQLGREGKTLKPNNVVTSGPYAEVKEIIGGYIIVKTDTIDEALKLAEGCPILQTGGNVELRDVMQMEEIRKATN
ncbi:transcription initiation protein [Sphingobacteriaceae bacterium]|nr:transcription initiation protein [Sphingobacteriaceae bacterium]